METGDYPAILTETCLPWVDANIRFRVKLKKSIKLLHETYDKPMPNDFVIYMRHSCRRILCNANVYY